MSNRQTDLEHGLEIAALAILHDDVRVLSVLVHLMEPNDAAALLVQSGHMLGAGGPTHRQIRINSDAE